MWRQLSQPAEAKSGMCMAVRLFYRPREHGAAEGAADRLQAEADMQQEAAALHAAVGYEDGTVAVWDITRPQAPLFSARLHSEPVMALSIDAAGTGEPRQCWDEFPPCI